STIYYLLEWIWVRGYEENSPLRQLDKVADIVLTHPEGNAEITAVGLKDGNRVLRTVFGDIDLENHRVIQNIDMSTVDNIPWNERELEEPMDESPIELEEKQLGTGRFECRSMFELQKRFQRIENIINQRPVFQLDGKIFTAFELLNGRKVYASKECNDINIEELFKNRSKFEKEVHELWQRTLMKRLIDTKKPTVIQKGDWLLIPNHMKKRYQWTLGQVMDLMPGLDGVTRNDFFHKRSFVNN
ncbi:hypothetical protein BLOT_010181, partial [Blomia tropicalis]